MKCNYITIEREYGSGGTKIARRLAEECGIPCYGQEILEAVSRKNNVPVDSIQHYEESVSGSFLYTLFLMSKSQSGDSDMLTQEGHIFLGHCAAGALKSYPGVVKVFIRANEEDKKKRIIKDYAIPERQAEAVRKKYDNKRSRYFYANTARRWTDLRNYDMILDSSGLGMDGCVTVLKSLIDRS